MSSAVSGYVTYVINFKALFALKQSRKAVVVKNFSSIIIPVIKNTEINCRMCILYVLWFEPKVL